MRAAHARLRPTLDEDSQWRLDIALTLLEPGLQPPWAMTLVKVAVDGGSAVTDAVAQLVASVFADRLAVHEHVLANVNVMGNTWRRAKIVRVMGPADEKPGQTSPRQARTSII